MRMTATGSLLAAALIVFAAGSALAGEAGEIWVWTTADGAIHYTDDRERVPEAFRASARVAHEGGGGSYQRVAPPSPNANARAPAAARESAEPPPEAMDPDAIAEAAWRDQARAIDARIAALAAKAADCGDDHVNRSPGDGSRKRRQEREEAQRCADAARDLASARADREALEERAHRAGAPPGWVRAEED
jgi:hypothetical protein